MIHYVNMYEKSGHLFTNNISHSAFQKQTINKENTVEFKTSQLAKRTLVVASVINNLYCLSFFFY